MQNGLSSVYNIVGEVRLEQINDGIDAYLSANNNDFNKAANYAHNLKTAEEQFAGHWHLLRINLPESDAQVLDKATDAIGYLPLSKQHGLLEQIHGTAQQDQSRPAQVARVHEMLEQTSTMEL